MEYRSQQSPCTVPYTFDWQNLKDCNSGSVRPNNKRDSSGRSSQSPLQVPYVRLRTQYLGRLHLGSHKFMKLRSTGYPWRESQPLLLTPQSTVDKTYCIVCNTLFLIISGTVEKVRVEKGRYDLCNKSHQLPADYTADS